MNKIREGSSESLGPKDEGAGAPEDFPTNQIWRGAYSELENEVRTILGCFRHARSARDAGRYPCEAGCGTCRTASEHGFGLEEA